MVWDKVLVVCILATVTYGVRTNSSNGAESDGENGPGPLGLVAHDNKAKAVLKNQNNVVYEYDTMRRTEVHRPILSVLSVHMDSTDNRRKLHRQKRRLSSTALRRIIMARQGRKRGSKKISRTQLPGLIARIKAAKKMRKKKAKESSDSEEGSINDKDSITDKDSIIIAPNKSEINLDTRTPQNASPQKNTPSPTNEINLTVHVDMNKPQTQSDVTRNGNDQLGGSGSYPQRFQTVNPNFPFAASNFPIQQTPNNILGIQPPFDNRFQTGIGQGMNSMYQRRYPPIGSGLAPVPVFSDPSVNARLVDNYFKNEMKISDEDQAFPVDQRAVFGKNPIRTNARIGSEQTSYPGQETPLLDKTLKTTHQPRPQNDAIRSDNSIQRSNTGQTLSTKKNNFVTSRTDKPHSEKKRKHNKKLKTKYTTKVSESQSSQSESSSSNTNKSKSGNVQKVRDLHSGTDDLKQSQENNVDTSELQSLLKDIKSIVGSLTPLIVNSTSKTSDAEGNIATEETTSPVNTVKRKSKTKNDNTSERSRQHISKSKPKHYSPSKNTERYEQKSLQQEIESLREKETHNLPDGTGEELETDEFNTHTRTYPEKKKTSKENKKEGQIIANKHKGKKASSGSTKKEKSYSSKSKGEDTPVNTIKEDIINGKQQSTVTKTQFTDSDQRIIEKSTILKNNENTSSGRKSQGLPIGSITDKNIKADHSTQSLINKNTMPKPNTGLNDVASNKMNTRINQDLLDKRRLSKLKSEIFLTRLKSLNIIADREIKMLEKMSPRWKKKRNDIHPMFNQLLRRKYFRDNVERLLDTELTGDMNSSTKLILSLMDLEDEKTAS